MRNRIGIDLGGTKIEGVVLDADHVPVQRVRIPTESERGYEHIVERVGQLVRQLVRLAPDVDVIGVGTPGAVSRRTGLMKNCNTTCLNDRDLPGDLARCLGRPVLVENDANCFALAEAVAGAGRNAALVFGVIMGTGVGGGWVYKGELLRGQQHIAGEWGHHCLDGNGPPCYCGQRGCVERYLSGPAVEQRYRERGGATVSMDAVVARARAGEANATAVFEEFLDHVGRALANVVSIIDPDVIVLGGGLSNIDEIYDRGRAAVARYVFNDELRTPIVRHTLGDSAGVIGAALLTGPVDESRSS
jgi:fructokinase